MATVATAAVVIDVKSVATKSGLTKIRNDKRNTASMLRTITTQEEDTHELHTPFFGTVPR